MGGAGIREIQRSPAALPRQVDEKVLRILETKFKLGLFENPYVDPDYAAEFVGNEEHLALAYEAAARSLTLLKHDFSGSPFEKGTILVGGSLADDADALNSGWKVTRETATSIFQAIAAAADSPVIAFTAEMPQEQLEAAGCAIVVVGEPASTHQPPWGVDNLEIPQKTWSCSGGQRLLNSPPSALWCSAGPMSSLNWLNYPMRCWSSIGLE